MTNYSFHDEIFNVCRFLSMLNHACERIYETTVAKPCLIKREQYAGYELQDIIDADRKYTFN